MLSPVEARILGSLLEKERTTPETYPLTLNSLATACNQSSNRDPIVGYDEKLIEAGLDSLREKKLAMIVHGAGARVAKYRHNLLGLYNLDPREIALLCVLLLRGAQTPGELRIRTERLCGASTVTEIENSLDGLALGEEPIVRALQPRPGQKEKRYVQLLTGEPVESEVYPQPRRELPREYPVGPSRTDALEAEIRALRSDLESLREEFASFRKQFE
jgi:uncharacterized protein YceH (UPF0502 family)